jgi:hypothetical protein
MNVNVEKEDVWVASLEDKPGALAQKLAGLAEAGADLGFVIARRAPEKPGSGVVFLTPLQGDREVKAATDLGFTVTSSLHGIRAEGRNEPGVGAHLTGKLAEAGINLRGLSAAALGTQYVAHFAFDTEEDALKAVALLQQAS